LKLVYCVYCGSIPGNASACPAREDGVSAHGFINSNVEVYCIYCGKTPGAPEVCPARKGPGKKHEFVSK
jgi:hypothetical protein